MSHVDRGALHAYLDGALDEYPAPEARRVRDHLDTCAECTRRLEEERLVREDAREILAMAAPSVEAPPLEELKSLARSGGGLDQARPRLRLYRLSWAASVVLAVGVGWMLRGQQDVMVSQDPVVPQLSAEQEAARDLVAPGRQVAGAGTRASSDGPVASSAESRDPAEPGGVTGGVGGEGFRETFTDAPAPDPVSLDLDLSRVADVVVQTLAPDVVATQPPALEQPSEPPPTGVVGAVDVVAAEERLEAALAEDRLNETAAAKATDAADLRVRSEIQRGAGAGAPGAAAARSSATRRRADGEADESGSLSVAGLDVIEVRFLGDGLAPTGVRILQRLETGDTLELIHLPEGVAPSSVGDLAEQVEELRVPRGSGWLIMRAPVERVRLEELLQRLDSLR